MPLSDFLRDLRQIEKTVPAQHGTLILDAFRRHTPFTGGAVYFRDGDSHRCAAKSQHSSVPDFVSAASELTAGHLILPLRSLRDELGFVALTTDGDGAPSDDAMELARTAEAFLSTLITNQRLMQETREGDFQLKYRLWELETLYDIGLSIASTLNIEDLADEILARMISLTNARRAALFLREGDRFRVYRTFGDVRDEFLDEELAGQLVKEGAPLSFEENTDCIFPGCCAYVALPIRSNNDVIGVLAAADRETRDGGLGAFEANDLRLLSLFASQVAIALENARLHRSALEKQAMERELELAATIQRDILPKAIPAVEGLEISALSRPAKQVGGDYHAFFERDGVISLLVADVAGKSMPAALLVSALHAVLQLLFGEGRDLAEIATELNRHIHRWSAENKFVTMIMIGIDRENETIEFVNAGHNPAYVISGDRIEQLRSHGLPVGILPQTRYTSQSRPFPAGSTVVLYSDGITEAESVAGDEFENDRLETILADASRIGAAELRNRIAAAVDEFTLGAPQKDDQTILIARSLL
jgi:sigma-B regulation protein RsbU (phosphoserine phosphatase)